MSKLSQVRHALGIRICGCSLFYKRELWASKSAGAHGTKSLKISGCKRWCPKDLRVHAPAAPVLTHSLCVKKLLLNLNGKTGQMINREWPAGSHYKRKLKTLWTTATYWKEILGIPCVIDSIHVHWIYEQRPIWREGCAPLVWPNFSTSYRVFRLKTKLLPNKKFKSWANLSKFSQKMTIILENKVL